MIDSNFNYEKYGLKVRLVNEEDSEFIIKLRTNPKLAKFLNNTQNDIEKQKEWIREYKIREKNGKDFYFLYYYKGEKIGLNRIYNINGKVATAGSWICMPDLPYEIPWLTVVIIREIFFEILNLDIDIFDTRKKNKKVIRMHHLLGAHKIYENEIDVFHYLTKDDFKKSKPKFLQYINYKE